MYEAFYGVTCRPFSKTPDPRFLYLGRAHEEAMARLEYAVSERELVVLTGEIGCGKTTLSRALMDSLPPEKFDVVTVLNPRLTPQQFLRTIARGLGIPVDQFQKDDLLDMLYMRLYDRFSMGRTPVIIIDEAQLVMGRGIFEEIRLLTNFQLDDTNLMSIVLIGQPDLNERLKHSDQQPLRQRIGMRCHLGPLSSGEIMPYLAFRLAVAGRAEPLFGQDAADAIFRYSGGVPRVINNLASNAMLEGFIRDAAMIGADIVVNVAREFDLVADAGERLKDKGERPFAPTASA